MNINDLPLYEIVLNANDDMEMGLQAVSFVDEPAIEVDFQYFKKEKMFFVNEEQRIVEGVALVPNLKIYRYEPQVGEFAVFFSKETIKNMVERYSAQNKLNLINFQHDEDTYTTDDATCIASFIIDKENGILPKNFENFDGAWFLRYKIHSDELWEKVKSGEFKGFSVETYTEIERKFNNEFDEFVESLFAEDNHYTFSDFIEAIDKRVQVELTYGKKTITAQVYDLTTNKTNKLDYVNVYIPSKDKWESIKINDIKNLKLTELPYVNWNFKTPSYKETTEISEMKVAYTTGVNPQNIVRAIEEKRFVMVKYNDDSEEAATGYRQGCICNYGYTAKNNEAVLFFELYGASASGLGDGRKYDVSPRCFLLRRMTDLRFLDVDEYDKAYIDNHLAKNLWPQNSPIKNSIKHI